MTGMQVEVLKYRGRAIVVYHVNNEEYMAIVPTLWLEDAFGKDDTTTIEDIAVEGWAGLRVAAVVEENQEEAIRSAKFYINEQFNGGARRH